MTTEILKDEMLSAEQLEGIAGGEFIPPAAGKPKIPFIPGPAPYPHIEPVTPPPGSTSIPASKIPQVGDFVPPAAGKPEMPFIPGPAPYPYVEPIRPKEQHISIPAPKNFFE